MHTFEEVLVDNTPILLANDHRKGLPRSKPEAW